MSKVVKFFSDGLRSLTANLGTSKDKATSVAYHVSIVSPLEIEAAYKTSWLAQKIIDLPAEDATRRWRSWSATPEDITAIEKEEKRLNIARAVRRAVKGSRLRGASAIYFSLSDVQGNPNRRAEPVDFATLGKDCIKAVSVISRHRLTPGPIDEDPDSPTFGGPSVYYLNTAGTQGQTEIHVSRLAIFYGRQGLSDDTDMDVSADRWNTESTLQPIFTAIKNTDSVVATVASMLFEAKIDVYKIPNFMQSLQEDPNYENVVTERFGLANRIKSINNAIILDNEEEHEGKQLTFSGVSEVMEKFFQVASGGGCIPVTRLFGRSPSGLNATGESDIRLYYDDVTGMQVNDIDPSMVNANRLLKISALGRDDEKIFHTWRSLWSPNEAEKAKMAKEAAEVGKILVDMGMKKEVAIAATVNRLIEMEVAPGLEEAVKDAGGIEKIVAEESVAPVVPATANGGGPTAGNVVPIRGQAVGDAAPRSLYISRKVINAAAIIQHYADQGVEGLDPAEELHITIAYNVSPVDWMKLPPPFEAEMRLPAGGPRLHDQFGEASVLLLRSFELEWRHDILHSEHSRATLVWSHPEYQPHITLGKGLNLESVEPWTRTIVLGPEHWEEVKQ